MSFPWFKVWVGIGTHPKVIALQEAIGCPTAGWYLVRLWEWASQNQRDGFIAGPFAQRVAELACGWTGKRGRLAAALLETGWLDPLKNGLLIHDWDAHNGKVLESATKDREYQKNKRAERKRELENNSRPTVGIPSPEKSSLDREGDKDLERDPPTAALVLSVGSCQDEPKEKLVAVNLDPLSAPAPTPQTDEPGTTHLDCWRYMGTVRAQMGRPGELRQPKGYERWHALATAQVGITALDRAYIRYLEDDAFAAKGWPTAIFMSDEVWSSRTFEEPPRRWRQ